jgi:glyoxylase-like metal-dependent hydrolase (beta-lactamase superfamily II)/rhodanese-related sulfurtransferase
MYIEQIYTGCLAQGAYYIRSGQEAAIIDPLRETQPYLDKAAEDSVTIKYIFETHFHADFVSGHIDLAKASGATIVYGPSANTDFDIHEAKDGEVFQVGNIQIKVLHTPGHTLESTTYLLLDEEGKEYAIFSGDTLFIGDVGRPDLAQKSGELTQEDLAGMLYDSLREKIMPLSDEVIVYPAHGAGSACGKNMSKETWDTLGNQKKLNYALRADMTREEFIQEVTKGLLPPPDYFAENVRMNKGGYDNIEEVMKRGTRALSPREFEVAANETDALILDVRDKAAFVKGFIPNSIFIGLDGSFAPWVGALIPDLQQRILIVAPEGRAEETVKRLARVGYDYAVGYLEGGFEAWRDSGGEVDTIETIDGDAFQKAYQEDSALNVLDVRKPGEFDSTHLEMAQNFPLDFINKNMSEVNRETPYYVHCRSGYRSTVAASILKARGFENLVNVQAKFDDFEVAGLPTVSKACANS